jgi:hypothetical protein
MKKTVFIFVPVMLVRRRSTQNDVVWASRRPDFESDANELVADENGEYPGWTTFLPNPLPPTPCEP